MIKIKCLLITFFICGISINYSYAVAVICWDLKACYSKCNSGQYCCKKKKDVYTCPTGWYYNPSQKLCTRLAAKGSDSIGYYTQTYTSCDAETSSADCYEVSDSNTSGCERCLSTSTGPFLENKD